MTSPSIWTHCGGMFLPDSAVVGGIPSDHFPRFVKRKTEHGSCFLSAIRSEHRIHNEFYAMSIWLLAKIWRYTCLHSSREAAWAAFLLNQFTAPLDMVVFSQDGVSGEEDWSNFIRPLFFKETGVVVDSGALCRWSVWKTRVTVMGGHNMRLDRVDSAFRMTETGDSRRGVFRMFRYISGWWFHIFFDFHLEPWGNDPSWPIFFKWVETTT